MLCRNMVFGGYSKVGFIKHEKPRETKDEDAFLYRLRSRKIWKGEKIVDKPRIFPFKKDSTECAIDYKPGYLCCFDHELWIEANCNQHGSDSYTLEATNPCFEGAEKFGVWDGFTVKEMEMFQIY